MSPPCSHRMSEACVFLTQQDPLKRSDMAPSRGNDDTNTIPEQHSSPGISITRSNPPRTGLRRPLSPVREYQVVTDIADNSEGSEMRTFALKQGQESLPSSPDQPISAASSGSTTMPPPLPPTDNELSGMETGEEETPQGSASSLLKSDEPCVPQHEMADSATEEESRCSAVIQRNKMILLQGLSLTSIGGSLTLVSLVGPVNEGGFYYPLVPAILFCAVYFCTNLLTMCFVLEDQLVSERSRCKRRKAT